MEDFENKIASAHLEEGVKNEYKDGVVYTNMKEDNDTICTIFTLMHEVTHAVRHDDAKIKNPISWKLAELPTLMNEIIFMKFLQNLGDLEISREAAIHMLYKLSDTKYMGIDILIQADLAYIYQKRGKVDYEGMKEYVESLDIESKKGMMFLQFGKHFIDGINRKGYLNYWKKGSYLIGELLGIKLLSRENSYDKLIKICDIIGRNITEISDKEIDELESIDIGIIDKKAIVHLPTEERESYREPFISLVFQMRRMELEKTKEQLLSDSINTNTDTLNVRRTP